MVCPQVHGPGCVRCTLNPPKVKAKQSRCTGVRNSRYAIQGRHSGAICTARGFWSWHLPGRLCRRQQHSCGVCFGVLAFLPSYATRFRKQIINDGLTLLWSAVRCSPRGGLPAVGRRQSRRAMSPGHCQSWARILHVGCMPTCHAAPCQQVSASGSLTG